MDSFKVQVSLKDMHGNLLNFRGDSVSEVADQLDEFASVLNARVASTHALLTGAQAVAAAVPVAPAVEQPVHAEPVAAAPAAAGVPLCDHGQPMRLVPAGVSKKTGAPYKAFYSCALPRETQCRARANA